MRALIVSKAGKLELADVPQPQINDYQALVRIECCGICSSTDWKLIHGQMPWAPSFPIVLGHESVGTVVEIGKRVTKFKIGDRVSRVVFPATEDLNSAFGGFAEYGIVTDAQAMADDGDSSLIEDYVAQRQMVVPKSLSPQEAALAISLSETASVFEALPNLRNKRVVVAGTGIAGLAFTYWAKLAGAHVTCLGRRDQRLKLARMLGADLGINTTISGWQKQVIESHAGKADGVIEAIGDVNFAHQLEPLIKDEGFLCAYGAPPDDQSYGKVWSIANVEEQKCFAWVADLIARAWLKPEWFISHTWTFEDALSAFEEVRQGRVLKGFISIHD